MRRLPAEKIPKLGAPRSGGRAQRRVGVRPRNRSVSPAPRLPVSAPRRLGRLRLYAYLRWHPSITGPVVEGGQLLRPPLRARRALVPGQLPDRPAATARRASSARRARATSSTRSRRSASPPSSPTCGSSPCSATPSSAPTPTTSTRSRSAASRSRSRTRSPQRRRGWPASASGCSPTRAYFSHAWWDHTYVARGLYAEQLERWLAVFPTRAAPRADDDELGRTPPERTGASSTTRRACARLGRSTRGSSIATIGELAPTPGTSFARRFAEPDSGSPRFWTRPSVGRSGYAPAT